jgi:hypothetical protein
MAETKAQKKTQPELKAVPKESPSPEAILLEQLVPVLSPKSGAQAQDISKLAPETLQLLGEAYRALPDGWVKTAIKQHPKAAYTLLTTIILPWILIAWTNLKGLVNEPFKRLDHLEEVQKEQGEVQKHQGDQLDRIEGLLKSPTSRPRE